MKAVVFHGIGDIRLEDLAEPQLQKPGDAIVQLTASAICGTDLHMIRGTLPGMQPGTILGHEGVGLVQELGADVRNLRVGDRVVIPSTIACGWCSYCRSGYHAQCDNANPNGPLAGTAFFGGPKSSGPFHGLQAEFARVPHAAAGLVKLPGELDDDCAILLSDIFPTGYFGAQLAEVTDGDTVAVFGCGPVGQFAIASAKLFGAGRTDVADEVDALLHSLSDMAATARNTPLTPQGLLDGLTRLAYEVGESKVDGGESRVSGTSINDMRNNVDGIAMAYGTIFAAAVDNRDRDLDATTRRLIDELKSMLAQRDLRQLDQERLRVVSEELVLKLQDAAPKLALARPTLELQ
jgi:threonine dehydrogenase-like Zn-dependent dehydrogenase